MKFEYMYIKILICETEDEAGRVTWKTLINAILIIIHPEKCNFFSSLSFSDQRRRNNANRNHCKAGYEIVFSPSIYYEFSFQFNTQIKIWTTRVHFEITQKHYNLWQNFCYWQRKKKQKTESRKETNKFVDKSFKVNQNGATITRGK